MHGNLVVRKVGVPLLAGALTIAHLLVGLASLHALLHAHAGEPEHQCLITVLQLGGIEPSAVASEFEVPPEPRWVTSLPSEVKLTPDVRLPSSRGPPVLHRSRA